MEYAIFKKPGSVDYINISELIDGKVSCYYCKFNIEDVEMIEIGEVKVGAVLLNRLVIKISKEGRLTTVNAYGAIECNQSVISCDTKKYTKEEMITGILKGFDEKINKAERSIEKWNKDKLEILKL